ncbi:MAG: hypothetical protein QXP98_07795 [Thermoproteus sp.]
MDLLVLNGYELIPCTLIVDVLGRGKLLYARDMGEYLDLKLRILKPCLDFMIDAERLDLFNTQIEAVMGRWGQ